MEADARHDRDGPRGNQPGEQHQRQESEQGEYNGDQLDLEAELFQYGKEGHVLGGCRRAVIVIGDEVGLDVGRRGRDIERLTASCIVQAHSQALRKQQTDEHREDYDEPCGSLTAEQLRHACEYIGRANTGQVQVFAG